jgi:8-oxo-dGTP pyrophosphatase MutT (NUDIX family)
MTHSNLKEKLDRAIGLDLPYSSRFKIDGGHPAAVLALLGEDREGETNLLLTRRTETVDQHRGQMAFPGGMRDLMHDGAREDPDAAALRETEEEVGIPRELVRILGGLPILHTPSGFEIHPRIGILKPTIEAVELRPNPAEIAETLWIRLSRLESVYQAEIIEVGPVRYPNHVFQVGPHRIWGATGAMVRNLLDRLAQA